MAGANHRAGWSNNPEVAGPLRGTTSRPLDSVYGADLVNVDRGHMILTGRRQALASPPWQQPRRGLDLVGRRQGVLGANDDGRRRCGGADLLHGNPQEPVFG